MRRQHLRAVLVLAVGVVASACGSSDGPPLPAALNAEVLIDEDDRRVELIAPEERDGATYWYVRWSDETATAGAVNATEESPIREGVAECAAAALRDDHDDFTATTLGWAIGPSMGTPALIRDAIRAIDGCGGLDDLGRAMLNDFGLPADRQCVAAQLRTLDGALAVVDLVDNGLDRANRVAAAERFAQCLDLFGAVEDQLSADGLDCLERQDPSIEVQFLIDAGTPGLRTKFEQCLSEDEMRIVDGG